MLKIISSKNDSEVYGLLRREKEKAKIFVNFSDCDLSDSQVLAENISIFGDKSAYIVKVSRQEDLEGMNVELLNSLEISEHFFAIVGSGAEFEKTVTEILKDKELKNIKLQKIEEKKIFDFPAELVQSLQKGDKKNSWNLMLKELAKKDAEPVHGSCVFAYKSLLVVMNDPKKNSTDSGVKDFSWKQASANAKLGKRERQEVVDKYFNLVLAYHRARNGELDLGKQLEKWVLEK